MNSPTKPSDRSTPDDDGIDPKTRQILQAAGSGIFFNTGRTISFDDHADGHLFFDAANVTVAAPRAHHVSRKPIRKAQAS